MKLKEFNIDTVKECDPYNRGEALQIYHDWLERQRKIDREIMEKEKSKIFRFKNRDKIRAYAKRYRERKPILIMQCLICNNEFQTKDKKRRYCLGKCYIESTKKYKRKYSEMHKEKINKKRKEYYQNNKEKIKEIHRRSYEINKAKILDKSKEYYLKNRESILNRNKKYYRENREEILRRKKRRNFNAVM